MQNRQKIGGNLQSKLPLNTNYAFWKRNLNILVNNIQSDYQKIFFVSMDDCPFYSFKRTV